MRIVNESLSVGTAYMLRNDGKLIPMSKNVAHPYVFSDPNSKPHQLIRELFISRPHDLHWFYQNTKRDETRILIKKFVTLAFMLSTVYNFEISSDFLDLFQLDNIPKHVNIEDDNIDIYKKDLELLGQELTMQTNQEFCRMRTSDLFSMNSGSHDVYFRIGSVDFNWFELIWQVVYENKNWITSVTISPDYNSKGKDKVYNHNGVLIQHLPTDDFLTLSGKPVFEGIDPKHFERPYGSNILTTYYPQINTQWSKKLFEEFVNNHFTEVSGGYMKSNNYFEKRAIKETARRKKMLESLHCDNKNESIKNCKNDKDMIDDVFEEVVIVDEPCFKLFDDHDCKEYDDEINGNWR